MIGLLALAIAVLIIALILLSGGQDSDVAEKTVTTAEVTQQNLVERETVSGTLGFGDSQDLVSQVVGTVTRTADEGDKVTRGEVLWRVDQDPTVLMYGNVPAYRTLSQGLSGRDVNQLEKNLKKLGYKGFTVDREYTSGTADAVADWQRDVGLPDSGVVTLGQVVFEPGAIRVSQVLSPTGNQVQLGSAVLNVTGTAREVAIDLDTADQSLADLGDSVVVTLPDGTDVDGEITSVGSVATGGSGAATGLGGGEQTTEATIPVAVTLDKPGLAKQWDSAPVDVALEADRADDVLTVPITALLALAEGGYAVEVVAEDGSRTLVGVDTGLFAESRVEVTGSGISAGTVVVVPTT
ncbi:MAG: peptidoglycan-binding protein [Actinomycetia bacterium]|nr:peptidoglycan-binding protein [Actinomycetes bacterium]